MMELLILRQKVIRLLPKTLGVTDILPETDSCTVNLHLINLVFALVAVDEFSLIN